MTWAQESKQRKQMQAIPQEVYTREYYEFLAWRYLLNDTWSWSRVRSVVGALTPQPGEWILDAGCGMGTFTIEGRKRGAVVIGLDYSFHALDVARSLSRWILREEATPLIQGSVYTLPFVDASFDKMIAADLVEHLTPQEFASFVPEAVRVVKPGGYIVIRTPNPVNIIAGMIQEVETASQKQDSATPTAQRIMDILKLCLYKFFLTLWRKGKRWLMSKEFYRLCKELHMTQASFPVLPAETIQAMREKYHFTHVDLKTARQIIQTFRRYSCTMRTVTVSQSDVKFQALPFPLNTWWGGHMTMVFQKQELFPATGQRR
jgi:SAM-dependent methyltransferase